MLYFFKELGCGTGMHVCQQYNFNISTVQPEQGELRFPPKHKKQGAAELRSVKLCVLVMTTVHKINRPPRETCMECGVDSSQVIETINKLQT